ncbi:hypothetical protein Ciccas_010109 [Cichlidogyrus casuarinus]|uniref:Uncharacterized protein n=1 Tax=Cichlidogyrus casuarinus TaxID=1844966 RepID=A0ABD2PV17_9PLAT
MADKVSKAESEQRSEENRERNEGFQTEIDVNLGQEFAAEVAARFDYIMGTSRSIWLEEYVARTLVKNESEKRRFGKLVKAMGPELRREYRGILNTVEMEEDPFSFAVKMLKVEVADF